MEWPLKQRQTYRYCRYIHFDIFVLYFVKNTIIIAQKDLIL